MAGEHVPFAAGGIVTTSSTGPLIAGEGYDCVIPTSNKRQAEPKFEVPMPQLWQDDGDQS